MRRLGQFSRVFARKEVWGSGSFGRDGGFGRDGRSTIRNRRVRADRVRAGSRRGRSRITPSESESLPQNSSDLPQNSDARKSSSCRRIPSISDAHESPICRRINYF